VGIVGGRQLAIGGDGVVGLIAPARASRSNRLSSSIQCVDNTTFALPGLEHAGESRCPGAARRRPPGSGAQVLVGDKLGAITFNADPGALAPGAIDGGQSPRPTFFGRRRVAIWLASSHPF
jgi:hypothetical protein